MTQVPENPNDRIDRLEATLTRFAELSFQSYRHHDETLSRLEANSTRHDEALNRLEANSVRHDQAIAQLLEVTSRNSESINRHDETLRRLEANAERMEQAVTNLSNTVTNNNNKIEQAITNLTNRLDTFIERSDAERETFIDEIRQIWRYLRYEPGNGTSYSDNG